MPPHTPNIKTPEYLQIPTQISNLHYRHCIHGYPRKINIAVWGERIALLCWCWREESVRRTHSRAATVNRSMTRRRMGSYESSYTKFFHRKWMQAHRDVKWTLWARNPAFLVLIPKPEVRSLRASRFFLAARTEIGPTCPMTQSARSEPITGLRSVVSIHPRALIGSTASADVDLVGPPAPPSTAQVVTQVRLQQSPLSLSGVFNYFVDFGPTSCGRV